MSDMRTDTLEDVTRLRRLVEQTRRTFARLRGAPWSVSSKSIPDCAKRLNDASAATVLHNSAYQGIALKLCAGAHFWDQSTRRSRLGLGNSRISDRKPWDVQSPLPSRTFTGTSRCRTHRASYRAIALIRQLVWHWKKIGDAWISSSWMALQPISSPMSPLAFIATYDRKAVGGDHSQHLTAYNSNAHAGEPLRQSLTVRAGR
jgi:hypothetical protein